MLVHVRSRVIKNAVLVIICPASTETRLRKGLAWGATNDLAEHPENVLVLNSLHHRAFDAGLFTLDTDYRIRVSPTFDPGHPFLRETIVEQQGDRLSLPPDVQLRPEFIKNLNAELGWL